MIRYCIVSVSYDLISGATTWCPCSSVFLNQRSVCVELPKIDVLTCLESDEICDATNLLIHNTLIVLFAEVFT